MNDPIVSKKKDYTPQKKYLKNKLANDIEYRDNFYENKKINHNTKMLDDNYAMKHNEYMKNYMKARYVPRPKPQKPIYENPAFIIDILKVPFQ